MRLYIAEKPSVGRAIAAVLGNPEKEGYSALSCNGGTDIVTWAAGHILVNAPPEDYNPEWKKWNIDQLPMIPSTWKKKPREDTKPLLNTIGMLLKRATEVVNAGDSDREGQLLVDEIIEYHNYKGPVKRLLITDTTPEAIRKSIAAMKDNSEYAGLSASAVARERSDFLLGINLTRLYTVRAGNNAVLSIGRVQTPTLGLVVNRDKEIENFKPVPYWDIEATFLSGKSTFTGIWQSKEDLPGRNEDGHCTDHQVVADVLARLTGQNASVLSCKTENKTSAPPLAPSLATLQIECNQRYGLSAAKTLELLQKLYEAGIVSYPRSDCQYLPTERHAEAPKIFDVISTMVPQFAVYASEADPTLKSAAWNDKKVTEHFGVIPTGKVDKLSLDEQKVFNEVARRYLALFLGPHEYQSTTIMSQIGDETFKTTGKTITREGWKKVFPPSKEKEKDEQREEEEQEQVLPQLAENSPLDVASLKELEKTTRAPSRFTEASLIKAMNSIYRYVADPELKKTLKEVEGIGTAATQASIIETLCSRGYLARKGKYLISQEVGRQLLSVVSQEMATPDLTAIFEQKMTQIHDGSLSLDEFMKTVEDMTHRLIASGKETDMKGIAQAGGGTTAANGQSAPEFPCPKCQGELRRIKGVNGFFWACQSCRSTFNDNKGKPEKAFICPACGGLLRRRKGPYGFFWGCRNLECKKTFKDVKGAPDFDGKGNSVKSPSSTSAGKTPSNKT